MSSPDRRCRDESWAACKPPGVSLRAGVSPITRAMILVTGGLGFIGSNLVAALGGAGRHGHRGLRPAGQRRQKMAPISASAPCAALIAPEALGRLSSKASREARGDLPHGRVIADGRDRRRFHHRQQFPLLVAIPVGLVRAPRRALHLWLVGRDLWQRRRRRLRRRRQHASGPRPSCARSMPMAGRSTCSTVASPA